MMGRLLRLGFQRGHALAGILLLSSICACYGNPPTAQAYAYEDYCQRQRIVTKAVVNIQGRSPQSGLISGVLQIDTQSSSALPGVPVLSGSVRGLTPGRHALFVDTYGSLLEGCMSSDDYSSQNYQQQSWSLVPIVAGNDGVAAIYYADDFFKLNGPMSIIGRKLMIYDTGISSRMPVACGVFGILEQGLKFNSPNYTQIITHPDNNSNMTVIKMYHHTETTTLRTIKAERRTHRRGGIKKDGGRQHSRPDVRAEETHDVKDDY
ncbi:SOD_CuZN1 [Ramazzottius varieornatus]|uniref:SOD_CuZN1 n=1 Tax=Ramazzottius varieornatus TaxID=947166 RepID=A0A1D1UDH8_RAMVA|nr:SOD_CuZN1 [Ramazzottius varieornatus]